jgi:hypothetical protein
MWKFFIISSSSIFLIIAFFGQLVITYGQTIETSQTNTYENTTEGIRYQYPSYWGNLSLQGGCIFRPCAMPFSPNHINETGVVLQERAGNFMIMRLFEKASELRPNCDCDSLTEFVRQSYESAQRSLNDFTFINDNQTTVGKKYPALQYEFSGSTVPKEQLAKEMPNEPARLVVSTNSSDAFYAFSIYPFTNADRIEKLPEFRKIIDSVAFLPVERTKSKIPSFMSTNETKGSMPEISIDNNPSGLQILSHNSFMDTLGYRHVVGEIKNNYPSTATFVKIIGTFYDVNNIVVGTDFTYTNPSDIGSGQKAPFELLLTSASIPVSEIDHYTLIASSQ